MSTNLVLIEFLTNGIEVESTFKGEMKRDQTKYGFFIESD